MTARIFLGWLAVTIVTVVLTAIVVLDRQSASFDPVKREPVFTELRAAPEAVQRIVVNSRFGKFALENRGGKWVAPERYGYPVDGNDVRRLIAGLSDMRYVERKTSKTERFVRLEVEDIDDKTSESTHVQVFGPDDKALVDIIVGRPSARFIDGASSGTYIREPGTDRVWLASGNINIQQRMIPWLQRTIVSVTADTVARVVLGSGGKTVELVRASAEAEDFTVTGGIEPGMELNKSAVTAISRALAKLEMEDVKPRAELPLPADAATATVTRFDGVAVTVRLAEIDEKNWAVFTAAYVGDDADAEKAAAARATVAEINARVGDWVYWVPSAAYDDLTKTRADIVRKKDEKSS